MKKERRVWVFWHSMDRELPRYVGTRYAKRAVPTLAMLIQLENLQGEGLYWCRRLDASGYVDRAWELDRRTGTFISPEYVAQIRS